MQPNGISNDGLPDAALWRKSRAAEMAEDEAERFLDLAGYADGRLDPDDRERVEERLLRDPAAAGDVAAARSLAQRGEPSETVAASVIARACAPVAGAAAAANVVRFPPRERRRPGLRGMAGWGSLAAAVAAASWLGFSLGRDASRAVAPNAGVGEPGVLNELLNPSTGFMRDLTESSQT